MFQQIDWALKRIHSRFTRSRSVSTPHRPSLSRCSQKSVNVVLFTFLLVFTIKLQGQVTGPILSLPGLKFTLFDLTFGLVWLIILLNLKFTLFDLTCGCHAALLNVSHANAVGHFPLRRTITLHKGNQRHC